MDRLNQAKLSNLREGTAGTTETRNLFVIPLLTILGYAPELTEAETLHGKSYAISHRDTKYLSFSFIPADRVFLHTVCVFTTDHWNNFAVVQSTIHEIWVRKYSGALKQDLRYSPSDCFLTFAFPDDPTSEPALSTIGETYHEHRRVLMRDLWLGLTDLYNLFHAPDLAQRVKKLFDKRNAKSNWQTADHSPLTLHPTARRELLTRLLKLNHTRAAEEQNATLDKAKPKAVRKPKNNTAQVPELELGLNLFGIVTAPAILVPAAEMASFASAYPSTLADSFICSLTLAMLDWEDTISASNHLDALILVPTPAFATHSCNLA